MSSDTLIEELRFQIKNMDALNLDQRKETSLLESIDIDQKELNMTQFGTLKNNKE